MIYEWVCHLVLRSFKQKNKGWLLQMEEKRDIGHAARSSEGRTAWAKMWNATWDESCRAAIRAESHATGRSMSRQTWAEIVTTARDAAPPAASDAEWNGQWTPAWNTAWAASWAAAIATAKAILQDRDGKDVTPPRTRPWDPASRAARATAGRDAGCAAWNETYRAEIKKVIKS